MNLLKSLLLGRLLFAEIQVPYFERGKGQASISISKNWQVLGPFQIGTREATWGADPLEYFGGFRTLVYDPQVYFRSSLGVNGTVGWFTHQAETITSDRNVSAVRLTVRFPDIDWEFLQSIYGWASLQYQAWARGEIVVNAEGTTSIALFTDSLLEFWIDNQSYFGGDLYAYRRAPLIVHLVPGSHIIELRLVRDVRAMGGASGSEVQVQLKSQITVGGVKIAEDKLILPEFVDGKLASQLASVPTRNEDQRWVEVVGIRSVDDSFLVFMHRNPPFKLAPGQTRPLSFQVSSGSADLFQTGTISSEIRSTTIQEPQKVTFLHPGGIVSYAILRPPLIKLSSTVPNDRPLPILLNLHGAGLEADSDQVRHMLDEVSNLQAWVLFPTGVTPWSGDDWHIWGFADVEAAIAAIPNWIDRMAWNGPQVDLTRLLVSGHSNGGQGTWFALTHQPDRVIGAAPVSGYSSIQSYVPYVFWNEADPRVNFVLQSSLVDYRHELFIDNFAGIPVLQQHGRTDDNVPVYHSRRMSQLISQSKWTSQYVELPDIGHWFDGVMTTKPLRDFYDSVLSLDGNNENLPQHFRIIASASGNSGSRAGIIVDQLTSPDQLGSVSVESSLIKSIWNMKTCNVDRFHLSRRDFRGTLPAVLVVDGSFFDVPYTPMDEEQAWFVRGLDDSWVMSRDRSWASIRQRYGAQLGTLDAILRTQGHITINTKDAMMIASQIARNLYQYFAADSQIDTSSSIYAPQRGNVIEVCSGRHGWNSIPILYPIVIKPGEGISVRDAAGRERSYAFENGLGAVFLTPLPEERLKLVIWGVDDAGLSNAARLLPLLTGVGQPDFVIVSRRSAWMGAAGALALGFFDHNWNVSQASYLS